MAGCRVDLVEGNTGSGAEHARCHYSAIASCLSDLTVNDDDRRPVVTAVVGPPKPPCCPAMHRDLTMQPPALVSFAHCIACRAWSSCGVQESRGDHYC